MVFTVNVHEAKTTLSRLLERVEAGERVVIARAGRPVADLVAHRRTDLVFGTARGEISFDVEAFDDPDAEIVTAFEANG